MNSLKISTSNCMPDDRWILMFKGKIVAVVFSGAPIEDAICDEIIVPHADYERDCRHYCRVLAARGLSDDRRRKKEEARAGSRELSRGEANIKWCEDWLYIPEGKNVGTHWRWPSS